MAKHRHKTEGQRTEPFTGPVASPENRGAHGNVCYVERCACGATRSTNVNGMHVEQGRWSASS